MYLLKIIAILKIDVEVDFSIVFLMTTYKALQNQLKQTGKLVFDHWTYKNGT